MNLSDHLSPLAYDNDNGMIVAEGAVKKRFNDHAINNAYDRMDWDMNRVFHFPAPAFYTDEGLGLSYNLWAIRHGFRADPHKSMHMLSGAYYLNAASFIIQYRGLWHNVLGEWDFGLDAFLTGPTFTQFFYGLGNDYVFYDEKPKYHVVKGSRVEVTPSLNYHFGFGSTFSIRPMYRFINIEDGDDEPRFIYREEANLSPESFGVRHYAGIEAAYRFERLDNASFPSRGGSIEFKVGAQEAFGGEGFGNGWGSLEGSLYVPFNATSTVVLATHFGVDMLIGEYEFFQALTLGGPNRVRGYRRDRFAGDARVYHATDLRFKLFQNRSIVPFGFGVYASFDYGRVWPDAGDLTSDRLHTAYGGGVFIMPLGLTAFRLGYMIGREDKQVNLGGALRF